MMRRRGSIGRGPGLVGTVARTAVIAGTASATAGAVQNRQMQKQHAAAQGVAQQQAVADLQQQVMDLQAQQLQQQVSPASAPAPEPAAPAAGGADFMAHLQQLADLRQAGMLTDDEFTAPKARLLGS